MLKKVTSAGTKAEQSTKVETQVPSANAIGNTHVVGSQSQPWMSYEKYIQHKKVYLEKIEAYIKKCKRESS